MANSQNGWPVNPPRRSRLVPGTEGVRLTVADGPAGDVLMYVVSQVDRRVENVDMNSSRGEMDDWGYAARPIRGGTQTSNHASATAVDTNATRHPLGVRGTFSPVQVREIHRILDEVEDVVRWGGDYSGRADEMHFEIVGSLDRVAAVAKKLAGQPAPKPEEEFMAGLTPTEQKTMFHRIMGQLQQRWMALRDGTWVRVGPDDPGAKPCAVLDTLDGGFIVTKINLLTERVIRAEAQIAQARGEQLTQAQVAATVDAELGEFAEQWAAVSAREEIPES